jgi:hypothetical protein
MMTEVLRYQKMYTTVFDRRMGLIRFGGQLSKGECDVQTDGRHTQATSASLVHRGDSAPRHPSEEALAVRAAR